MAQISPWSVKGVSPQDREAAKRAARQAGLPVGAWLSQAIRHAGQEPVSSTAAGTPSPDPAQTADIVALRAEVAALTARLESLSDSVAQLRGDLSALADSSAHAAAQRHETGDGAGELPPEALAAQAALERAVLRLSDRLRVLEEEAGSARGGKSAGFLRRLFGGG